MDPRDQYLVFGYAESSSTLISYIQRPSMSRPPVIIKPSAKHPEENLSSSLQVQIQTSQYLKHYIPLLFELV
jgi:hypothetical protein